MTTYAGSEREYSGAVTTRAAAVAGLFYPDEEDVLRAEVRGFITSACATGSAPKALIAPHAGTKYSGPVAASAYARLTSVRDRITRVVLLGPAHRVAVRGLAASSATAFDTPLGTIPIDRAALDAALALPGVATIDEAHHDEHSLELHLPFLQFVLGSFSLAPFVVGACEPSVVAEVLEALWGGPETLIVVSSDLSHFHDYEAAMTLDRATSEQIERLSWEELDHDGACGFYPVRGLLKVARSRGMRVETVDVRNSGDTAGSRERVVGYGSYLFH